MSESYQIKKLHVMSLKARLFYWIVMLLSTGFIAYFALWWFQKAHIPQNFIGLFHIVDILLFLILSYVVWYQIVFDLFLWVNGLFMRHPEYVRPEKGMRVAFLTAFVPGKEPFEVLEKSLKAMVRVDYPHDTWVLDEGDDEQTKRLCAKYRVNYFTRRGIRKYNTKDGHFKMKTKAGNYNAWYDKYSNKYDFIAQIDVDFVPKKNFLMRTLGYFSDRSVGFVGSPQIYGNTKESWIVKGAAEQAYGFFGTIQKSLFYHDMPLFIGANHVVRVEAHNSIGGYSGHIVEDHLTGMHFYQKRWKSVYVPEVLAVGEGPSTWDAYFSQQMRWAYGLFHILFTKSPRLFLKMKKRHALHYAFLQHYYFYGVTQALSVGLLLLYFFFGMQATSMELTGLLQFFIPYMIIQFLMFIWLQRYNIDPKNERGFMMKAKILNLAVWPIYFLAFVQVITGRRLTYKVTPKGGKQEKDVKLSLFIPHMVFGILSILGIVVSFFTEHQAMQLIFWAWLNSVIFSYFVLNEILKKAVISIQRAQIKMYFPSLFLLFKS